MVKNFKKVSVILLILFIIFLGVSSVHAQDVNNTNNDTIGVDDIPVKVYSDLYDKINSTDDDSTIELNESYRFDSSIDNDSFVEGVVISKNITLIGKNNTFIDGNFLASGFNITSNCRVILKNITFINGYSETSSGSVLVGKNSKLLVDNCTFYNNKVHNSNGGAIYGLEGTDIEIRNSVFDNNVAERRTNMSWNAFKCGMGSAICMRIGSNLRLFDSIFKNNDAYVTTILIITWDDVNTNQSTLYVDNCTFENNVAWSNCAIYLDEFGIAEIKNSIFKKNNSTNLGGTIVFDASKNATVINCTFEDNHAVNGGGIYSNTFDKKYDSTVGIYDCTFKNNVARDYGGGIFAKFSNLVLSNCELKDNLANLDGGGMYFDVGFVNITNCEFTRNSAQYGGGLVLKANESSIVKSSFVNNGASLSGGGIYSARNSVMITDSRFIENSAQYGGGALLKSKENLVVKSTFENNDASKSGGAIYSNVGVLKIEDSHFKKNSAEYGGGLFLKSPENAVLKSTFESNVASKSGGAIYSNIGILKIQDSHFTKNSAEYGGGLLLKTAENAVIGSSFSSNVASKSGGAIYSNVDNVITSGCSYHKNSAPKASDVYGVYHAKVTKYVAKSGETKLKIVLTSIWKMHGSKKIKVKLKGFASKWLKTNSKGVLTFTVPKNKKVNKKTLSIAMHDGACIIKNYVYKNPGKIYVAKSVKKSSKLKVTVKNSNTKKAIKKTKFTVKIFTGKKYKKLSLKTNSRGFFNINITRFSVGDHKISVYLSNKEYYINKAFSFKIK